MITSFDSGWEVWCCHTVIAATTTTIGIFSAPYHTAVSWLVSKQGFGSFSFWAYCSGCDDQLIARANPLMETMLKRIVEVTALYRTTIAAIHIAFRFFDAHVLQDYDCHVVGLTTIESVFAFTQSWSR